MTRNLLLGIVLGASVWAVAQQAPKIVNAQFHTEPVGAGLSATVDRFQHASGPLWLGYAVAAIPGSHFTVCSGDTQSAMDDGCCGVYRLEETENTFRSSQSDSAREAELNILVRIDQGGIDKIRFVGGGCPLDVGGLPFTWLTGVSPEESLNWLMSLVTADSKRHTDQALAAIAAHGAGKATTVLTEFASSTNPLWMREKAGFWLGASRGHDGLLALEKLTSDSDPEFREKLAFDLSVNHDPESVNDLIRMAKSDADTKVREQAVFWVAQKAGAKALAALKDTLVNDPEVAVKKKAVFALSQLPKDEAVPELLHVAQSNSDPSIRKEAIFWLGQTHDPRALAYFEQILEH